MGGNVKPKPYIPLLLFHLLLHSTLLFKDISPFLYSHNPNLTLIAIVRAAPQPQSPPLNWPVQLTHTLRLKGTRVIFSAALGPRPVCRCRSVRAAHVRWYRFFGDSEHLPGASRLGLFLMLTHLWHGGCWCFGRVGLSCGVLVRRANFVDVQQRRKNYRREGEGS